MNPSSGKIAAYCDVDGTLTHTTIVTPLVYMKMHALRPPWNWLWAASLLGRGPWWALLDQFSRSASNRAIYSNYQGVPAALVRGMAEGYYRERILPKLYAHARNHLQEFEREGVQLVLVTGGLDVFMVPMAREFRADCLAPQLEECDGVFTGRLLSEPFTGAVKARLVREHAASNGVDLQNSYALGDAIGDLPMLECVGQPVAVNPDKRLAKVAADRGWQVQNWR